MLLALTFGLPLLALGGLVAWRWSDRLAEAAAVRELVRRTGVGQRRFDPALVDALPEAARRYFHYTITPGAPLRTAIAIELSGELGLGTKAKPDYRPIKAHQVLAPPFGFVWRVRSPVLAGSDGLTADRSWTRFWLFGLLPVARISRHDDHHRSAFGRLVAEAAFWSPASLLPSEHVRWESVDPDTARAVMRFGGFEQAVDISVDEAGQPVRVQIARWSNENPERVYRLQPFGGYLSAFRDFGGYRLPTRVEGGNLIGTPDYFTFYRVKVESLRMLGGELAT